MTIADEFVTILKNLCVPVRCGKIVRFPAQILPEGFHQSQFLGGGHLFELNGLHSHIEMIALLP